MAFIQEERKKPPSRSHSGSDLLPACRSPRLSLPGRWTSPSDGAGAWAVPPGSHASQCEGVCHCKLPRGLRRLRGGKREDVINFSCSTAGSQLRGLDPLEKKRSTQGKREFSDFWLGGSYTCLWFTICHLQLYRKKTNVFTLYPQVRFSPAFNFTAYKCYF